MASATSKNEKRGPGRPRTGRERRAVTLTLSNDTADFLDTLPAGERSKYVDSAIKEKRERKQSEK